jgi:hypothetical protein
MAAPDGFEELGRLCETARSGARLVAGGAASLLRCLK